MAERRIGALIPAAGLSSRMAGFKPLLEIGGKTLVEQAIGLFRSTGIDEIVTVVGHRSEDLIRVVEAAGSRHVLNDNYQDGMFSSIQRGVKKLKGACEAFFLLPVDIPFVRPLTIHLLLETFIHERAALVCYPQYNSRRGHPPLIDSCLIDEILAYDGKGGMRGLLSRNEDHAVTVPVEDPFIRMDIDTPEDLFHLKEMGSNLYP